MNFLFPIVKKLRAISIRALKPRARFLFVHPTRKMKPVSTKYGFDRGLPIDRYYIESFLMEHAADIQGKCLEIHDDNYTKKFGSSRVTANDVLDIDTGNTRATIHGDLRNLAGVPSHTYNCLIITQTFGMIDDYEAAIRECMRVLKPGGVILTTATGIGPAWDLEYSFWRFTVASMRHLFTPYVRVHDFIVRSYGNVFAAQCALTGFATEDLTKEELDYHDPHFPVIVAVRGVKQ